MIIPDVNLLLYAEIDSFAEHDRARQWWEDTLNSGVAIGLTEPVLYGFLRIGTSRKVIDPPLSVADAVDRIRTWSGRQQCELLRASDRHVDTALALLMAVGTGGNLTTDAQLAAYAIERNAELHSHDTDFARFPGLRWIDPIAD